MNFKSGESPAFFFPPLLFLSELLTSNQTLCVDFAPADRKQESTETPCEKRVRLAPSVTSALQSEFSLGQQLQTAHVALAVSMGSIDETG